jgi:hypothetical protein
MDDERITQSPPCPLCGGRDVKDLGQFTGNTMRWGAIGDWIFRPIISLAITLLSFIFPKIGWMTDTQEGIRYRCATCRNIWIKPF